MPRVDAWTHEEMILVLNLYLKLPFGKMDRRNPAQKGRFFLCSGHVEAQKKFALIDEQIKAEQKKKEEEEQLKKERQIAEAKRQAEAEEKAKREEEEAKRLSELCAREELPKRWKCNNGVSFVGEITGTQEDDAASTKGTVLFVFRSDGSHCAPLT